MRVPPMEVFCVHCILIEPRKILSDPAYWSAVEILAEELKHAPNHELEEKRIHSIVSQALADK